MQRVLIGGGVLAALVGALVAAILAYWQTAAPPLLNVTVDIQADAAGFQVGEPLPVITNVVLENVGDGPLKGFAVAVEFFPKGSAGFEVALPVVRAMPDVLRRDIRPQKDGSRKVTFQMDELPPAAQIILKFNANQDADLRISAVAEGYKLEEEF